MKQETIVQKILENIPSEPVCDTAYAFAPSNLALCKYWGKRDTELNLPIAPSLSISLANKGAFTNISYEIEQESDRYLLKGKQIGMETKFAKRLTNFLNLFRPRSNVYYRVMTDLNIPVAAGLASSACGFAALVLALNAFYNWNLSKQQLSILARLGSGSACRSLWKGFVEWQGGTRQDGMDSYGVLLSETWPELRIGALIVSQAEKTISSREAMQITQNTSPLYKYWPEQVASDLSGLKQAIRDHDFELLGRVAEANALLMHEMMLTSTPSIKYSLTETCEAMNAVWELRAAGAEVFFTQDAGPNLQLLFSAKDSELVKEFFPQVEIIAPFSDAEYEQVIKVDNNDQEIQALEKVAAHQSGSLHRAFSVFVLRERAEEIEVLLQKRQDHKYHCAGLWSNTCCGHPRPGENTIDAAQRRLQEEMGFAIPLKSIGSFQYQASFPSGLIEHEIDHVLVGLIGEAIPEPNPYEVQATLWMPVNELKEALAISPDEFTPWLKEALTMILARLE